MTLVAKCFRRLAIAVAALLPMAAAGQQMPAIGDVNAHDFLSVPFQTAGGEKIFYEVCNANDAPSIFFWRGAGFGLSVWGALEPNWCAFKRLQTDGRDIEVRGDHVAFHRSAGGPVDAWTFIEASDGVIARGRRVVSEVMARMRGPEGQSRIENMAIAIEVRADGSGLLNIVASDQMRAIAVVIPEGELVLEELDALVRVEEGNAEIESSDALETLMPIASQEGEVILDDVTGGMPAIVIRDADGLPIDATLFIEDLARFGPVLWVYGQDSQTLRLRDTLPVPQK